MRRMFLHIDTGFTRIEDTTGRLFRSLAEAKSEAVALIGEVAFAWSEDGKHLADFHVDICNDAGMLVEIVPVQNLYRAYAAK